MTNPVIKELSHLIISLEDYDYPDAEIEDKIFDICEKLRGLTCHFYKEHDFYPDQCGYWQHSYCMNCWEAKHPNLIGKSCQDMVYHAPEPDKTEYKFDNISNVFKQFDEQIIATRHLSGLIKDFPSQFHIDKCVLGLEKWRSDTAGVLFNNTV